jgi:hypothetical protein
MTAPPTTATITAATKTISTLPAPDVFPVLAVPVALALVVAPVVVPAACVAEVTAAVGSLNDVSKAVTAGIVPVKKEVTEGSLHAESAC